MVNTLNEDRFGQDSPQPGSSSVILRKIGLVGFGIASTIGLSVNGIPSDLFAQGAKDKTEKKAETPEQKFAAYRQAFQTKGEEAITRHEQEILKEGVPGVRRFLNAFLRPAQPQGLAFSLRARSIVIREARAGGKGNPEIIAMVVDRLANPGHPTISNLEQLLADIGVPAIDRLYAAFDGSAWKDVPIPPDAVAERVRRRIMSSKAAATIELMLGEDEKHIPDDALLPRLHGTLVAPRVEKDDADDDVRPLAAGLLMRRFAGDSWLQKASVEERTSRAILLGLKSRILQSKGQLLQISDKGPALAKRYRDVIRTVQLQHPSFQSESKEILDLLTEEESFREKRLKEFQGKK